MATEEISHETKVKFRLDWKDLDKYYAASHTKYVDADGPVYGYDELEEHIVLKYPAKKIELVILHGSNRDEAVFIARSLDRVKKLKCEVDLEVLLSDSSKIKIKESSIAPPKEDHFVGCPYYFKMSKTSQIQTITGIVTLTFELEDGFALKDEMIYRFGDSILEPLMSMPWYNPEKPRDIKIECQGEKFEFHKVLLSKISDVFQNMVENPNFIESQNGIITIKDVSPNTIKAFEKLLYDDLRDCNDPIEKNDLDAKFLIFCDKYNIKLMEDLCSKYLQQLQKKISWK